MRIKTVLSVGLLMTLSFVIAQGQDTADLPVRQETTRQYQLPVGTHVEVTHINGTVEIEAVEGDTAEVYFQRSANSSADLERFDQIQVKQEGARLFLRGTDSRSRGIEVNHQIKLRLPSHCALRLHEINGQVVVSGMAGALRLSSINGGVALSEILGELEMKSINGGISLALQRFTTGNIHIRDVRDVELRVANDVHAQLDIAELDTAPSSETLRAQVRRVGENRFQVRIGNGGPTIRIIDVNGKVKIL